MSIIFRIKRRLSGDSGKPNELQSGELAFNEVDGTLYIGTCQENKSLSCININLSSN